MIIPIIHKEDDQKGILEKVKEITAILKKAGVRVMLDDRDNYNPGWKYNHWELKGIPLRIELGKKDMEKEEVRLVRRLDGSKQ